MTLLIVCLIVIGSGMLLAAIWHGLVAPWLRRGPSGVARIELIWRVVGIYARIVHRIRYEGFERCRNRPGGPLLVVANHRSALDPLLIQLACPAFYIHWMMAKDQMSPDSHDWWRSLGVIPTDRSGGDTGSVRSALRYLRRGEAVGVFPEGQMGAHEGRLGPFHGGVGTLASRTGATILMITIDDTPPVHGVLAAFFRRSRARITVVDLLPVSRGEDPAALTRRLRQHFHDVTGWPLVDDVPSASPASDPFLPSADTMSS